MIQGNTVVYLLGRSLVLCQFLHTRRPASPCDFDTEFILTSFQADAGTQRKNRSPASRSSARVPCVCSAVFPREHDEASRLCRGTQERSTKTPSKARFSSRRPIDADFLNTYLTADRSLLTARTLFLATVEQLEHSCVRFRRSRGSLRTRNSLGSCAFPTLTESGIGAALGQDNIKIPVGITH
jgi:hypothetical protein